MAPDRWKHFGSISAAVSTIVGDHFGLYGRSLDPATDLKQQLGSDDVDFLEVIMTLEEFFDCQLQPLPQDMHPTIGALIELCRQRISNSRGLRS